MMTPSLSLQIWIKSCTFESVPSLKNVESVKPNTTLKLNGSFCASDSICIDFRKAYYMVVITLSLPWHSSLYYMAPERVGDVAESAIGWLLDVTVERNAATLWIKLKEGGNLRIVDINQVSTSCQEMSRQVPNSSISYLHNPRWESSDKLTDIDARRSEIVLCVYLHKTIIHSLRGCRTTQE